MKKRKKQRGQKLTNNRFLLWVCLTVLITFGAGVCVVVINWGKAGDINVTQSEDRASDRTGESRRQHSVTPITASRNPVVRIYDKVARLNELHRELNRLPSIPVYELRPTSLQLQTPPGVSEADALKNTEQDLDKQISRLEQLLANN